MDSLVLRLEKEEDLVRLFWVVCQACNLHTHNHRNFVSFNACGLGLTVVDIKKIKNHNVGLYKFIQDAKVYHVLSFGGFDEVSDLQWLGFESTSLPSIGSVNRKLLESWLDISQEVKDFLDGNTYDIVTGYSYGSGLALCSQLTKLNKKHCSTVPVFMVAPMRWVGVDLRWKLDDKRELQVFRCADYEDVITHSPVLGNLQHCGKSYLLKQSSPHTYLVGSNHWSEALSDFSLGQYTQLGNLIYLVGKWVLDKLGKKDYHDATRYLEEITKRRPQCQPPQ